MYFCRVCGEAIPNYMVGSTRGRICNECFKAYHRYWEKTSAKGKQKKLKHRDWARNNYLGIRLPNGGNKYIRVSGKRSYTGYCEMCGTTEKRLVYHHWDNEDFSMGIWICQNCHNAAETVEKGLTLKYLELRNHIEKDRVGDLNAC